MRARQGRGLGLLQKHSQPKPTGTMTLPQGVGPTLVSPPSGTACLCQGIQTNKQTGEVGPAGTLSNAFVCPGVRGGGQRTAACDKHRYTQLGQGTKQKDLFSSFVFSLASAGAQSFPVACHRCVETWKQHWAKKSHLLYAV